MGRNGMGKTTLFKTLMGILPMQPRQHRPSTATSWPSMESYQRVAKGSPTCRRAA